MEKLTLRSRAVVATCLGALALASMVVIVSLAATQSADEPLAVMEFPTEGPFAYKVEYLGITCGHMALESRLEEYEGRPAYHVVMTASNTRFFNKIYRVDGQIESWIDVETMGTIAYTSDITERGRRKIRRFHVDFETGAATAERRGKVRVIPFDVESALDPMAYVYRGRALAGKTGSTFMLNLLTDDGVIETGSEVGELKKFSTVDGKKRLLRVQPVTANGEMFDRKGKFIYWIDPGPARTAYRLEFHLPFGKLLAKYMGPAEGSFDRRTEAEKAEPTPTPPQKR